ncbi:CRISPR-associated endonuclease Cas9 [Anaerohalosphaera lusitana]|uniref:CRISPR-associated endonuclease Cas9 n=1 Tax=Anaerohalosphaera lusitana TaxID=1936003 RepID=A0A1U9NI86_9BACT|nr:type II CRISPR RNA-guided endonuclease Cas9 [Anaerohalosphaera lusitana]AQT67652.1 CRISPR-associated endonuclease Cas9 [Anaerohalosphaera lusitana]
MGYVLGLDLGPTSIGWAAIEVDENERPVGLLTLDDNGEKVPAMGSRIFPVGVINYGQGKKREQSNNKKRRDKRSVRRRLRRARARRLKLIGLLKSQGLLNGQPVDEVQQMDPYELRAKGVSEKLEPEEFARILLHFAKRRGFKSNRRKPIDEDAKGTDMKKAKDRLEAQLDGQTLGEFWYDKLSDGSSEPIRNRRDNFKWLAQRKHYQEELGRIWAVQSAHYPEIFTHGFYKELEGILFDQIPFELTKTKKKKVIGMCSLMPGKVRCGYSERIAQKFRTLQKVNDLRVEDGKESRDLCDAEREVLVNSLSASKDKSYEAMRKKIWGKDADYVKLNLEYRPKEKIRGNEIDSMMVSASFFQKKAWLGLTEQQKDEVWGLLRSYLDESLSADDVEARVGEYGLEFKKDNWTDKLKEPVGTCSYSKAALNKIVPLMEEGKDLYTAIQEAGLSKKHEQHGLLPVPDKAHGFAIPNPVVQTVMFQMRKIVNLLIKEVGPPERIVIETTRELKASKERRQEILKKQSDNLKDKEKAKDKIREMRGWSDDVRVSNTDVMKWRLWEEQNHYCPYRCKKITLGEVLSREVEIDHILPYSMSLDNTMANKVVCFAGENQEKGQNTPISWLGENSAKWRKITEAMSRNSFNFSKEKWERFGVLNEEIEEKYQPERLIRDTSYIAREVRAYLKRLYPADYADQSVRTASGKITFELRNLWQLNAILRDGELGPKNRDDLRHHAVDAAVVAVTTPGMIQRITRVLQDNWPKRPKYAAIAEPWEGFGEELASAVEKINVSHRVQRKVKGALHGGTHYGKIAHGLHAGKFVTRKNLSDITKTSAENICDPEIRDMALARLKEYGGKAKDAFAKPLKLENKNGEPVPVKKVRIWENSSNMIKLERSNKNGNSLDNSVWVKPGENHHVEIFVHTVGGKDEYVCKGYTIWEAGQRVKNKQPIISRQHPDYPEARFIMSLSKRESLVMKNKSGTARKVFVLSISTQPTFDMEVRPLSVGDVRNLSDKEKKALRREWRLQSLKALKERLMQKITLDPLGRVRRAGD